MKTKRKKYQKVIMKEEIMLLLIPIYLLIIVLKPIGELFFEAVVYPIQSGLIRLAEDNKEFWNQILGKSR